MSKMSREELVQHLTPPPGITMPPYPAKRDKIYRLALVMLVLGLLGEAIASLIHSHSLQFWMQGWISASLIVAGWTFLVWLKQWRWVVRSLVILGLVLWPLWPLGGWALSLAGSAIMAAKETHCFHFWAGKVIPWYSVTLGILLILHVTEPYLGLAWLGLAALWLSLVLGRAKLPLFEV
ncbi:hypothetical protein SAMN00768000_3457 [Sulfobacillus thermosulfidooxidans DSM 9293]|uniref:DUF308 domain-containing protein n=1 Tax=Sulfobacillus thermosulfidooxidans (strain DSM 9293 / VKM B-1269 / AT-1) TaxID=929705 RepID=A0A1W1WN19_SULTA|nr:hypothetical protein [Sulfobacillus thermosulfidooxidans]SMC07582.1 hypothetical protein SAMN00768000_3457 [Sulfobacillus thermosulfidooxidans DSM 9293]